MMRPLTKLHAAPALVLLACVFGLGQTHAQGREHNHDRFDGRFVLDERHHNDHYYPAPGGYAPVLPRGAIGINYRNDQFFFHGGVWFRPYGGRYRVVVPPIGIVVSVLPPTYVTLRIGGMPYYYANGVYYTAALAGPGYVVVAQPIEPPGVIAPAVPAPAPAVQPPARPDPIIYPRKGQSAEQLEADRQECNRWATNQPAAMADASVFNRAVEACMDGRGYTMR